MNTKCGQSKLLELGLAGDQVGPGTDPDFLAKHKSGSIDFVESLSENVGIIHGIQKSLAIQMPKLRKRDIHNTFFFFKKKRGFIPGGAEKGGIRAHMRTMSYIGSYPPRMS